MSKGRPCALLLPSATQCMLTVAEGPEECGSTGEDASSVGLGFSLEVSIWSCLGTRAASYTL